MLTLRAVCGMRDRCGSRRPAIAGIPAAWRDVRRVAIRTRALAAAILCAGSALDGCSCVATHSEYVWIRSLGDCDYRCGIDAVLPSAVVSLSTEILTEMNAHWFSAQ